MLHRQIPEHEKTEINSLLSTILPIFAFKQIEIEQVKSKLPDRLTSEQPRKAKVTGAMYRITRGDKVEISHERPTDKCKIERIRLQSSSNPKPKYKSAIIPQQFIIINNDKSATDQHKIITTKINAIFDNPIDEFTVPNIINLICDLRKIHSTKFRRLNQAYEFCLNPNNFLDNLQTDEKSQGKLQPENPLKKLQELVKHEIEESPNIPISFTPHDDHLESAAIKKAITKIFNQKKQKRCEKELNALYEREKIITQRVATRKATRELITAKNSTLPETLSKLKQLIESCDYLMDICKILRARAEKISQRLCQQAAKKTKPTPPALEAKLDSSADIPITPSDNSSAESNTTETSMIFNNPTELCNHYQEKWKLTDEEKSSGNLKSQAYLMVNTIATNTHRMTTQSDLALTIELFQKADKLITQNPASKEYQKSLVQYGQIVQKINAQRNLRQLIGGIALSILGAGLLAASIAVGVMTLGGGAFLSIFTAKMSLLLLGKALILVSITAGSKIGTTGIVAGVLTVQDKKMKPIAQAAHCFWKAAASQKEKLTPQALPKPTM